MILHHDPSFDVVCYSGVEHEDDITMRFRTAATLWRSTVGMSAVGLKPIVEVQFADYIFPGINQLYTEVSKSYE